MSLHRFILFSGLLTFCFFVAATPLSTVHAASSIVVNDVTDSTGIYNDGKSTTCTLRQAILNAIANRGLVTVTFGISGTITLGSPLPTITNALTLDGTGRNIEISGADKYQVLVNKSASLVTVNALTITHAKCSPKAGGGGGITNYGALSINNARFLNNDSTACPGGGAISNEKGTAASSFYCLRRFYFPSPLARNLT